MKKCKATTRRLDGHPLDMCHCQLSHGHAGEHRCEHGFSFGNLALTTTAIEMTTTREIDAAIGKALKLYLEEYGPDGYDVVSFLEFLKAALERLNVARVCDLCGSAFLSTIREKKYCSKRCTLRSGAIAHRKRVRAQRIANGQRVNAPRALKN